MILTTKTTVALRCPECGKLDFHPVSLFDFSGARTVKVNCSCGTHKFTVGTQNGQFWIQFPCLLCDSLHFTYFSRRQFWEPWTKNLTCPETELDAGFFGLDEDVREVADGDLKEAERILNESGFEEYFESPDVMYQILNALHDVAETGKLACPCGHKGLRIDIFPERLELYCPECGRFWPIPARDERDLKILDRLYKGQAAEADWNRRHRK